MGSFQSPSPQAANVGLSRSVPAPVSSSWRHGINCLVVRSETIPPISTMQVTGGPRGRLISARDNYPPLAPARAATVTPESASSLVQGVTAPGACKRGYARARLKQATNFHNHVPLK